MHRDPILPKFPCPEAAAGLRLGSSTLPITRTVVNCLLWSAWIRAACCKTVMGKSSSYFCHLAGFKPNCSVYRQWDENEAGSEIRESFIRAKSALLPSVLTGLLHPVSSKKKQNQKTSKHRASKASLACLNTECVPAGIPSSLLFC